MGYLKRHNGMRGSSEDGKDKLIDIEEEDEDKKEDMYEFRDRWTSGWV